MKNGYEEHLPSSKRAKFMDPYDQQQWCHGGNALATDHLFNPIDNEPSPLGLRLTKSPSFLDLIQLNLCQKSLADESGSCVNDITQEAGLMKNTKCVAVQASADKRKATNFSASTLRIGTWKRVSRFEGDLVVKCYFAKRKLVWEILEGGLKSKIEIQWSDITALKASCPKNQLGTLYIELSRPPMFFKESNPQPRKHTLWQAASDFTGGQATIYRRHFVQFPPGILDRHYEKLIQYDPRLNMLSKQAFVTTDSPYFDSRLAAFEDHSTESCYWALQENKSHVLAQPAYLNNDYYLPPLTSFSDAEQVMAPSLAPELGHFEPEKFSSNSISTCKDTWSPSRSMLDNIAQYLLGDSFIPEEQSIIDRLNSTYSNLKKQVHSLHTKVENCEDLVTCDDLGETYPRRRYC